MVMERRTAMKQKAQQIAVAIGLIISMLLAVAPVFSSSDPCGNEAWQTPQNRVGYRSTYSAGFEPALPERDCLIGEGGRSHA
jgi:hypothetical protein